MDRGRRSVLNTASQCCVKDSRMRKFVGVTLVFSIAVAVIAGTCVAFAMLMAPAEIKQIGAAKNVVSKPPIPDVPAAPIEQKTQENVGSVRAASARYAQDSAKRNPR